MTAPAVSVLMLCYNRPRFMRQAIESVLAQTFGDFEFIVMDHASCSKEPLVIAEEYAAKDSRMRVFRVDENRGVSWGRNQLLAEARGEFVATIEDDDWWVLDKLENQVAFLRERPEVGGFYCSLQFVDAEGKNKDDWIMQDKLYPPQNAPLAPTYFLIGSGQLFRRAALNAVGGWREWFIKADDCDLIYRLQEKFPLHSSSWKMIYYRIHDNNLTTQTSILYDCAAIMSAHCRREGMADIIEDSQTLELTLERGVACLASRPAVFAPIKKAAKLLLRQKRYSALRRVFAAYKTGGGKRRLYLFVKLLCWSLKYNRLGFWRRRESDTAKAG